MATVGIKGLTASCQTLLWWSWPCDDATSITLINDV